MEPAEKLTLMKWSRQPGDLVEPSLTVGPAKLMQDARDKVLRAIWRPVMIASRHYVVSADIMPDGELASVTFRNLETDERLSLTALRSRERIPRLRAMAACIAA